MAKFKIISQFLKDFSFESPNVPELFFKRENTQAKLEINIDLQIKGAENNLFMVDLITKVHSKLDEGEKSIFLIESTYSGLVQMDESKDAVGHEYGGGEFVAFGHVRGKSHIADALAGHGQAFGKRVQHDGVGVKRQKRRHDGMIIGQGAVWLVRGQQNGAAVFGAFAPQKVGKFPERFF